MAASAGGQNECYSTDGRVELLQDGMAGEQELFTLYCREFPVREFGQILAIVIHARNEREQQAG
jgi:hypothetical protein